MMGLRIKAAAVAAGAAAIVAVGAPAVSAAPPSCNWGQLTADSIAAGFDQGSHASNQANPRAGLANVVNKGDLNATCELIKSALP